MEYTLEEVLTRLEEEMPSLSPTAAKVQELGNDINCPPGDLTRVIKLDPVLTARIMKLVNSSYCSPAEKIVSLEKAIIMMGLNTIKALALSVSVLTHFQGVEIKNIFEIEEFWKHSLAVGVTSKLIAQRRGVDKKIIEDYFLAGLIHDLGLLVESQFYPEEMTEVLEQADQMGLLAAEDYALCNLNHCLIGKALGEKWGFSKDLIAVLLLHHESTISGPYAEIVLTVHLADHLCRTHGIGLALDVAKEMDQQAVYASLGIPETIAEEVLQILPDEINKAMEFLKT
ncbi:MAG: HDOD domain-containing protein [Planctomycetes bacterium]|nr:HDOD domain-containing protein [Planctomycetota bacterium]